MATQNQHKVFDVTKLQMLFNQLKNLKDQAEKLQNGFYAIEGLIFNDEVIIVNYELIRRMKDAGYTAIQLSILHSSRPGKKSTTFLSLPQRTEKAQPKERIVL